MIPPMTAPMIATTIAALNSWMSMSIMSCFIFYYFAVLCKQIVPQKYGFFCGTVAFLLKMNRFCASTQKKRAVFAGRALGRVQRSRDLGHGTVEGKHGPLSPLQ